MTGAQESAYARLRKDKKKSNVRMTGYVNGEMQVEWTEKDAFDEDRKVEASIAQNGLLAEVHR